jgi:hypothetical protein
MLVIRLLLIGCLSLAPVGAADVTFADVAPIIEARCAGCHRPGEIGPMPLTSYAEARPWAKAIRQAVVQRTMPPWHADRETSVRIANSRALRDDEIQTVTAWVDGGAKASFAAEPVIHTPALSGGWKIGRPDLVIRVPGAKVPSRGTYAYTFLVTPVELPADTWISAAEWKIDQRTAVHHMNAFIRPPGSSFVSTIVPGRLTVPTPEERSARHTGEREVDRRELLAGYEPGYTPAGWGEGRAKLLRKGSAIVFEIHYNTTGKELTDYSELGIYFASQPPVERVLTITPADAGLAIPAGDANYSSHVTATLRHEAKLISLQPHMHLRGKAFEILARYPDGRVEALLRVPRYDFNWQTTYFLAKPLQLPAGTILEYTAWFDNSANNRFNPDPSTVVHWGDQSWEEMNIGFTELAFDATSDPDVAVLSGTTRPGSKH